MEKILALALPSRYGSRQSSLPVFRKSEIQFRLVSTTKDELHKYFHREEGMNVSMNLTGLIPAYANPNEGSERTHNMLLCTNQAHIPKWYTLGDAGNVTRFQQAPTNYRTYHQSSSVAWSN